MNYSGKSSARILSQCGFEGGTLGILLRPFFHRSITQDTFASRCEDIVVVWEGKGTIGYWSLFQPSSSVLPAALLALLDILSHRFLQGQKKKMVLHRGVKKNETTILKQSCLELVNRSDRNRIKSSAGYWFSRRESHHLKSSRLLRNTGWWSRLSYDLKLLFDNFDKKLWWTTFPLQRTEQLLVIYKRFLKETILIVHHIKVQINQPCSRRTYVSALATPRSS